MTVAEQERLGEGGLPGVAVAHEGDVADLCRGKRLHTSLRSNSWAAGSKTLNKAADGWPMIVSGPVNRGDGYRAARLPDDASERLRDLDA